MRLFIQACFVVVSTVTAVSGVLADEESVANEVQRPQLRNELLERMDRDQQIRQKFVAWMRENPGQGPVRRLDANEDNSIIKQMLEVDRGNRTWLAKVIQDHGWPGKTLVGEDGAHAAWLLVQHADHDREFQQKCLELMQSAPEGEVAPVDIAYLVDRVRVGQQQPQLYATQLEQVDGQWKARFGVEGPDRLDERRQRVGLPPFSEYVRFVETMYEKAAEAAKPAESSD